MNTPTTNQPDNQTAKTKPTAQQAYIMQIEFACKLSGHDPSRMVAFIRSMSPEQFKNWDAAGRRDLDLAAILHSHKR